MNCYPLRSATYPSLTTLLLIAMLAITAAVYYPGLGGDFMFDDAVHISQNQLVEIDSLAPDQLYQAWNSSAFSFPSSRPLSMLTFGLNHVFTGFDPYWFKVTNLLIHLLCGILLFLLTRITAQLFARTGGIPLIASRINWWALAAASIWLLHPINLSPVLYIVQRMAGLSTLFLLMAMVAYVHGRMRLLDGTGGTLAILLFTPALGALAFLCKENAALLPGFLFVLEATLFRFKTATPKGRRLLQIYFLLGLALPLAAVVIYLLLHLEWLSGNYGNRPFTLLERLMSEARAMWFYLQMIFGPDNTQLGFYHDDFKISHSLLNPPTTLFAILGIIGLITLAVWQRKNAPILTFGILFFFVGHAMESTIIPLELIFEHRNYMPSIGLFIALSYYLIVVPDIRWQRYCSIFVFILFVMACANSTHDRAQDWKDEVTMIIAEAKHHPDSPRANFRAGQLLITIIMETEEKTAIYEAARYYLEQAISLNPRNADGLFGLIVLHLHLNLPPEQRWLDTLKYRLEHIPYSPLNVTTGQFAFLVRWHITNEYKLPPKELLGIFSAVLHNPTVDHFARAGIHAALQNYYLAVLNDPESALKHGYEAVKAWPQRWHYQTNLIQLLLRMGLINEALRQLHLAIEADTNEINSQEARLLEQQIRQLMDSKDNDN
ncbi:hypothetical protein MNBD_GAMMA26-813 [hydrothermal vent metagenome]|uniref:Uncharacterized protein n=1 Tax=hydrothermal vent metagenome TaxID=652676 RepID=A0A3B1AP28_9ZZZZ